MPDGKTIITGDVDGTARMIDLATNKVVREFKGHTGAITSVAASVDGAFIATGGVDKMARVFDANTGNQISAQGHTAAVHGVAFMKTDKGMSVWSASEKKAVNWMPEPGAPKVIRTVELHAADINAIAVEPTGKVAVSGSNDGVVIAWDPNTGTSLGNLTLSQQKSPVTSLAIDPTSKKAIAADAAGNVVYFDAMTAKEASRFKGLAGEPIQAVAFTKDGKKAIAAGKNKALSFDPMTGMQIAQFSPTKSTTFCGTIDPVGNRAILGGDLDSTDPANVGAVHVFAVAAR